MGTKEFIVWMWGIAVVGAGFLTMVALAGTYTHQSRMHQLEIEKNVTNTCLTTHHAAAECRKLLEANS